MFNYSDIMEVQRTSSVTSYRLARGTAGEGAAAAGRGGGTEGTARRPVLGGNGGADYVPKHQFTSACEHVLSNADLQPAPTRC